jgi:DNA repair exonuclease SbcCD ATPase subunit
MQHDNYDSLIRETEKKLGYKVEMIGKMCDFCGKELPKEHVSILVPLYDI